MGIRCFDARLSNPSCGGSCNKMVMVLLCSAHIECHFTEGGRNCQAKFES